MLNRKKLSLLLVLLLGMFLVGCGQNNEELEKFATQYVTSFYENKFEEILKNSTGERRDFLEANLENLKGVKIQNKLSDVKATVVWLKNDRAVVDVAFLRESVINGNTVQEKRTLELRLVKDATGWKVFDVNKINTTSDVK